MEKFITYIDIRDSKSIGGKIREELLNECIDLAQSIELYDFLGDLYFDVLENYKSTTYHDLMEGSTFTINGDKFIQTGLKSMLIDLAYARYIQSVSTNVTPFGITTKTSQDSTPVDRNMIKDMVSQIRRDADIKFIMIKKYLTLSNDKDLFKRFYRGQDQINNTSQNFSVVKGKSGSRIGYSRKGYNNDYYRY